MASAQRVEVLRGRLAGGFRWVVHASGDAENLTTMVEVFDGERQLAGKGFGGPGLSSGSVMNSYCGKTDDLPYLVLVRTAASIDRVVALSSAGTEVELTLSEPYESFGGLRFGFAELPGGHPLRRVTAQSHHVPVESWPRTRPG